MLLEHARQFLRKFGVAQTTIILSLCYFVVGGVVAFLMKLSRYNPLVTKNQRASFWKERKQAAPTIENYLKQY